MSTMTILDKDEHGKSVNSKVTASKPDIIFSVCLYARYQSNPIAS